MTAETHYTPREIDLVHGRAIKEDAARNAPPPDPRQQYITGLRILADVLEKHPEVKLPIHGHSGSPLLFYFTEDAGDVEAMAAARKALPCTWRKSFTDGGGKYTPWFNLSGELAGLAIQLYAPRDAVCERVVTGTEDREVDEVVQPEVTRKVVKPVEVVEWRCHPILAPDDAPGVTS